VAQAREDYGIDAPTVVCNLAAIGLLLLTLSVGTMVLLRFQVVSPGPIALMLRNGGISAMACLVMAGWMIACSKWLKKRVARALLDDRAWRGDERVLDVGCGRGLVAVAAARRVPQER